MARKRARRHEGAGSITKYQTAQGQRWQAKLPHGLTDPETGRASRGQFATRDDAQAWLDATIPAAKAARGGPAGTLGEWLTAWLAGHADAAPATVAGYRKVVERHVRPHLGDAPLRGLSRPRVVAWLDALAAAGVSAAERVRAAKYLRTALNAAVARGLLPANPTAHVKLPKKPRPDKAAFTPAQVAALLAAARPRGLYPHLRLWFDLGLRPGEMFALEWGDFAADLSAATVRRAWDDVGGAVKPTKTDRVRTLVLSAGARAALLPARKARGLVMPAPKGGYWNVSRFRRNVWLPLMLAAGLARRVRGKVDLGGLTPYAIRHTMASVALSAGESVVAVSKRLGHDRVSTTLDDYAHAMPDDAEKVAAAIGEAFG